MRTVHALLFAAALATPAIAADFKLPLVDGGTVELAAVRAKGPVLVDFWATWCHPCQEELLHVQQLYQTYADSGISFLAVAVDDAKTKGKVRSVARGKRLTMPVLLDSEQEAMRSFGLTDVPGVFILGPDGATLYQHTGYKPGDEAQLEQAVRAAIHHTAAGDTASADTTAKGGANK